jgi:hypothetical protein
VPYGDDPHRVGVDKVDEAVRGDDHFAVRKTRELREAATREWVVSQTRE